MTNYPNPLTINQFDLAPVQGQLDLETQGNVITGQVDSSQTPALIAGQAVKMSTTSGGVPKFIALAANTDKAFGFVVRNLKDQSDAAYANFEVAFADAIMWMTAGAAITRGASVEVVYTTNKVIASAGVNPVVGIALDTATVNGDLIRVLVKTPSIQNNAAAQQTAIITATIAQINAGLTLIPGQTGQTIKVSNVTARVLGTFLTDTSVELESTNASPVAVATYAQAQLTTGALLLPTSTGVTLGAGFAAPLGSGDGLQVVNNGSAATGGTSITFTISYQQN